MNSNNLFDLIEKDVIIHKLENEIKEISERKEIYKKALIALIKKFNIRYELDYLNQLELIFEGDYDEYLLSLDENDEKIFNVAYNLLQLEGVLKDE